MVCDYRHCLFEYSYDPLNLVTPCRCGTRYHYDCLMDLIIRSGDAICPDCRQHYQDRRIHRDYRNQYGRWLRRQPTRMIPPVAAIGSTIALLGLSDRLMPATARPGTRNLAFGLSLAPIIFGLYWWWTRQRPEYNRWQREQAHRGAVVTFSDVLLDRYPQINNVYQRDMVQDRPRVLGNWHEHIANTFIVALIQLLRLPHPLPQFIVQAVDSIAPQIRQLINDLNITTVDQFADQFAEHLMPLLWPALMDSLGELPPAPPGPPVEYLNLAPPPGLTQHQWNALLRAVFLNPHELN